MLSLATHEVRHFVRKDTRRSEHLADDAVIFRWHFPRGTLGRRMSGLELATFLLPHMPTMLPYLNKWPDVHGHFTELLRRFVQWPAQVLDEVLPWVRSVTRTDDFDIVELSLTTPEPDSRPLISLP